jgi:fatty acid desaturase
MRVAWARCTKKGRVLEQAGGDEMKAKMAWVAETLMVFGGICAAGVLASIVFGPKNAFSPTVAMLGAFVFILLCWYGGGMFARYHIAKQRDKQTDALIREAMRVIASRSGVDVGGEK